MIEFKSNTPTIAEVYQYTYSNKTVRTRFANKKRDILPSKIKIEKRTVYKKNKEGEFTAPEERLFIYSESAPQYYPYNKVKTNGAKRQLKIRHHYDIIIAIQKTPSGNYSFWDSKIIWRVGSLKKYPKYIPQNKVKTIHNDTRQRIERKYAKLPLKEKRIAMEKEFNKIRKNSPYLNDGDYVSQEFGINGDNYFRDYPLQVKFNCLYGRCYHTDLPKDIAFPFFCKHALNMIEFLLKKGIIKYK